MKDERKPNARQEKRAKQAVRHSIYERDSEHHIIPKDRQKPYMPMVLTVFCHFL